MIDARLLRRLLTVLTIVSVGGPARAPWPVAAQVPPTRFYGTLTIDGMPAPAGTRVVAEINGKDCSSYPMTADLQPAGRYVVDATVGAPGCGTDGALVSFRVGARRATKTGIARSGDLVPLDLVISGPGMGPGPETGPATGPTAAPTTGATSPDAGPHRFSGRVTIEGVPAPEGVTVVATIGGGECGRAAVDPSGGFSVEVDNSARRQGCGRSGAEIRFTVEPAFGDRWSVVQSFEFRPGATSQMIHLAIDLKTRLPDPNHVPLLPRQWDDLAAVLIGTCDRATPFTREAAGEAINRWINASREQGLLVRLKLFEADACSDPRPGIAIWDVQNDQAGPRVWAAHEARDFMGNVCAPTRNCRVYSSSIYLNLAAGLSRADAIRALAHEIGHALGLDHAPRCTGGTIMYGNDEMHGSDACRFPATAIGVDDIAALNDRYARRR